MRVDRPDRQVLRHPLDEPQRRDQRRRHTGHEHAASRAGHVELERVHQLVAQHVVGLGQRAGEGEHHPTLEDLGDAAGALPELPGQGVGLPEVGAAGVEDQCLAVREIVVEQPRQPRVPPLGHEGGVLDRQLLLGVVVDVEVLGLEHFELEVLVLHLVPAEVLRVRRIGHRRQPPAEERRHQQCRTKLGMHSRLPKRDGGRPRAPADPPM